MNTVFASVTTWVRNLAIALSCTLVLLSASPALAIGSNPSSPEQGTVQLDEVYNEAEKSVQPENALDGGKMADRANKGLNEVQKDATTKSNSPANSQHATAPMEKIEDALSNLVN
ncbi:MAG: hypothetical protein WBG38_12255 [Nodosilinea sp.]